MYTGLNNLGLTGLASSFSPSNLFTNGEGGAHFETYDPQTLLRRRNQLTWSSQFANAAWTRTNILSITENADGVGDLVVPSTSSGSHVISQTVGSAGVANTLTVRAKAGGYSYLVLSLASGGTWFNLTTGAIEGNGAGAAATITPVAGLPGYYDCTVVLTPSNGNVFLYVGVTNNSTIFTGDGTSGVYLARAQLEWNTTTPSAYQEVTDWNTEYLAAVGSSNVGMWQDSAGTTATYAVEQPVGKWIDKSGRGNHATQSGSTKRPMLSARVNLLTKTEQFDDPAWSKLSAGTGSVPVVTANAGTDPLGGNTADRVVFARGAGATSNDYSLLSQGPAALTVGAAYRGAVWVKSYSGATQNVLAYITSSGGLTNQRTIAVGDAWTLLQPPDTVTRATSASIVLGTRGTFGGDATVDLLVWGADFRSLDDAAKNIPAYQRVNTSTDYDTVGFPHYLKFDGTDDGLQTGNIDFSGVNKMTVWAGATKLSDAAGSILLELGTNANAADGSFFVSSPHNSAVPNYGVALRGITTTNIDTLPSAYAAPVANVFAVALNTGAGSTASQILPRLNGSAVVGTYSAGTGAANFANAAINIGLRNNSSAPYNGRLTSLTVRGSLTPTDTSTISKMERYAGGLMKISF